MVQIRESGELCSGLASILLTKCCSPLPIYDYYRNPYVSNHFFRSMGMFTDQIFETQISLDLSEAFETMSEFALGYPVKGIDKDGARITLNIIYLKRWLLYTEVQIRIFVEDKYTSRVQVIGKMGASMLRLLPWRGTPIYRIHRFQFQRELIAFLEPYVCSDDAGVHVEGAAADGSGTLR